jgi:HSP20 family protein
MRELTPWNRRRELAEPQDFFGSFRREMDRAFDSLWRDFEPRSFLTAGATAAVAWPSVDVDETDAEYKVSVELPGMDEKDVQLQLRDNALTISGEKKSEREDKDGGRYYAERVYGRFERTIPFGAEIDADKVTAEASNGVLKVVLPKNAKAQDKTRTIEIRRS